MQIKNARARRLDPQDITKNEIDAILRRLQVIDDWSKKFGCRMGLVGESGMKVFRYLAYSYIEKGWACFPSYRWIASKVRLSRSTVGEALRRLKRIGAVCWKQRRRRMGKRWVQGANLYRIAMPSLMTKHLPRLTRARKAAMSAPLEAALTRLEGNFISQKKSASGERTLGATTDLKKEEICGVPTARTVFLGNAERAMGSRGLGSEERGDDWRLKAALARLACGVSKRRQHGKG